MIDAPALTEAQANNYFIKKTEFNTIFNKVYMAQLEGHKWKLGKTILTKMFKNSMINFFKQEGAKYGYDTTQTPDSCPKDIKEAYFKAFDEANELHYKNINTIGYFDSEELSVVRYYFKLVHGRIL